MWTINNKDKHEQDIKSLREAVRRKQAEIAEIERLKMRGAIPADVAEQKIHNLQLVRRAIGRLVGIHEAAAGREVQSIGGSYIF